jgi:hypothetical protein
LESSLSGVGWLIERLPEESGGTFLVAALALDKSTASV